MNARIKSNWSKCKLAFGLPLGFGLVLGWAAWTKIWISIKIYQAFCEYSMNNRKLFFWFHALSKQISHLKDTLGSAVVRRSLQRNRSWGFVIVTVSVLIFPQWDPTLQLNFKIQIKAPEAQIFGSLHPRHNGPARFSRCWILKHLFIFSTEVGRSISIHGRQSEFPPAGSFRWRKIKRDQDCEKKKGKSFSSSAFSMCLHSCCV